MPNILKLTLALLFQSIFSNLVSFSFEPTNSHVCQANSISNLPEPSYFAVSCFNAGAP